MLDAAVVVFAKRGYHEATVDEVAEAAGISKPMVYAYLGTKEELFVACLRREGVRLIDAITAEAGAADLPPDERLWRGLRAFFGFVAERRDGWRVLYRQARGQEPFAEVLARFRLRMAEIVTVMVAEVNQARGGPAGPADIEALGFTVVGAAEALAEWVIEQEQADPEATATRLMNVLWVGMGPLLGGQTWR
jgi:AcrR family transcriptional regulator